MTLCAACLRLHHSLQVGHGHLASEGRSKHPADVQTCIYLMDPHGGSKRTTALRISTEVLGFRQIAGIHHSLLWQTHKTALRSRFFSTVKLHQAPTTLCKGRILSSHQQQFVRQFSSPPRPFAKMPRFHQVFSDHQLCMASVLVMAISASLMASVLGKPLTLPSLKRLLLT